MLDQLIEAIPVSVQPEILRNKLLQDGVVLYSDAVNSSTFLEFQQSLPKEFAKAKKIIKGNVMSAWSHDNIFYHLEQCGARTILTCIPAIIGSPKGVDSSKYLLFPKRVVEEYFSLAKNIEDSLNLAFPKLNQATDFPCLRIVEYFNIDPDFDARVEHVDRAKTVLHFQPYVIRQVDGFDKLDVENQIDSSLQYQLPCGQFYPVELAKDQIFLTIGTKFSVEEVAPTNHYVRIPAQIDLRYSISCWVD